MKIILLSLILTVSCYANIFKGPITNASNGHIYWLVIQNTHDECEWQAMQMGGHLVTINDQAEQDWVYDTFSENGLFNLWIGLVKIGSPDFYWLNPVTSSSYRNWAENEPNSTYDEVVMCRGVADIPAGKWLTMDTIYNPDYNFHWLGRSFGGVVEIDPTPRKASAYAFLSNGGVGNILVSSQGGGYTNAPSVAIIGDGVGAQATAVMTNGAISKIIITDRGSGYTIAPQIYIEPPPSLGKLEIRISKFVISQFVVIGETYVLETSTDGGRVWRAISDHFIATESLFSKEVAFDPEASSQLYRLAPVKVLPEG